jgi:hypothetical protein
MVFLLGGGAVACSVFAARSCEFFSYESLDGEPWEGFEPPFKDVIKASVGLFRYSLQTDGTSIKFGDECVGYSNWSNVGTSNLFQAAQWCAVFAPWAGGLAWSMNLFEFCCCEMFGSFFITSSLFFAAAILQGCSFFVFGDTNFWYVFYGSDDSRLI